MRRTSPWRVGGLVLGASVAVWAGRGVEAHAPAPADLTPAWQALGSERHVLGAPRSPRLIGRAGSPTAVWGDVAGWDAPHLQPTNRSTAVAVSADGRRVAVAWLHNGEPGPPTGPPTAYASVGVWGGAFAPATAIGAPPFHALPGAGWAAVRKYNAAHNGPVVLAVPDGFRALTMPMNVNGYAEMRPPTGYAFAEARWSDGRWAAPMLAPLADTPAGSSLSEVSAARGPDGTLHLFGQGHLGRFQGAFAHQFRPAGQSAWRSVAIALPHRPSGLGYFAEGVGAVTPGGVLHVAFAWNRQGATPMYGLYHLQSPDGGRTWRTAAGRPVALPLRAGDPDAASAAVVPAALSASAYGGAAPGVHGLSLAVAPDGSPVIVRLHQLPGDPDRVQARVWVHDGRRWTSVPVGRPAYWNQGGTAVTVNAPTRRVNVLLLDPGGRDRPGQVYRHDAPVTSLRQGRAAWRSQVVGEAPNPTGYGSSLVAAVAPDRAFVFLFEPAYRNPGRVSPVMGRAALR